MGELKPVTVRMYLELLGITCPKQYHINQSNFSSKSNPIHDAECHREGFNNGIKFLDFPMPTRIPPATAGNTLKDNICSLGGCKLKVVSSDEGTSHYEVVSPKSVDVEKLRKAMCRAETKYFKVPIDKRPCKELFVATAIKEAMDKGEV